MCLTFKTKCKSFMYLLSTTSIATTTNLKSYKEKNVR